MIPPGDVNDRDEVLRALRRINDAWLKGPVEDMRDVLHPHIVLIAPAFGGRDEGPDACIASYDDFRRQANVFEYRESDISVDIFGASAVATYRFDIVYEMGGERFSDSGHDVFVFVREEGAWRAAWRTLIPEQRA